MNTKRFELLQMNLISPDTLFEICTCIWNKHVYLKLYKQNINLRKWHLQSHKILLFYKRSVYPFPVAQILKLIISAKRRNYSIFKNNINCEIYLHILTGQSAITMFKFRTGNHKFPVEVGRWNGIDLSERKCNLCLSNNIGDEFHYLLECTFFTAERRTHIGKYYYQRPNVIKYKQLLETTQEKNSLSSVNLWIL